MHNTAKHHRLKRFAVCLSFFVLILSAYFYSEYRKTYTGEAKQLLVAQSKLIQLGSSMKRAEELISIDHRLTLRKWGANNNDNDIVEWRINTPPEIGAKEWVLTIFFKRDGVVALGFRTADSNYERPDGTPEDHFSPEIEEFWRAIS